MGDAILGALYDQRRHLQAAAVYHRQEQEDVDASGNVVQRMSERLTAQHLKWYAVAAILAAAIGVLVWFKWISRNSS